MITISLCMIVKNEAHTLGACLESVDGVVDEIIIVDTGSTDETIEIAKQFTDKIYTFRWEDDFSKARNFSFSHATGEYILWLDADDRIVASERAKLIELKETLDTRFDSVMMKYYIDVDKQGLPKMSFYRERLVRRDREMQWVEPVHEVIQLEGYSYYSDIYIVHSEQDKDQHRNLMIYEKYLQAGNSLTTRGKLYYARELYDAKRYREAKERFLLFLEEEEQDLAGCTNACLMTAYCNRMLEEQEPEILYRSFKYTIPKKDICCELGNYFLEIKNYKKAILWYEITLQLPTLPYDLQAVYYDYEGYLPHLGLCRCYASLGDREKAIYHNEQAAKYKPNDARVIKNRILLSMTGGMLDGADDLENISIH